MAEPDQIAPPDVSLFDTVKARADGVSDKAIADFLAPKAGFDLASARKDGVDDRSIVNFLAPPKPVAQPTRQVPQEETPSRVRGTAPAMGAAAAGEAMKWAAIPTDTLAATHKITGAAITGAVQGGQEFALNQLGLLDRIDAGEAVKPTEDPLGYGDADPAQRKEIRAKLVSDIASMPKPEDTGVGKAGALVSKMGDALAVPGEAIDKASDRLFPLSEKERENPLVIGAQILTGLVPYVGAGAAGGLRGVIGYVGAETFGRAHKEALAKGATPEDAAMYATFDALAQSALMTVPLANAMGVFRALPAVAKRPFLNGVVHVAESGATLSAFSQVATLADNAVAKSTFDPDRDMTEGVGDPKHMGITAAVGAVLPGAAMVAGRVARMRARPEEAAKPVLEAETVDGAIDAARRIVEGEPIDTAAVAAGAREFGGVAEQQQAKLLQLFGGLNEGDVVRAADGSYHYRTGEEGAEKAMPLKVWDERTAKPAEAGQNGAETISPALARAQRDVYGRLGIDVVYFENDKAIPFDGAVDPRNPDTIFLSNDPQRNAQQVGAHEVTHVLESTKLPDGTSLADVLHSQLTEGMTGAGLRHAYETFGPTAPERAAFPEGPQGDSLHGDAVWRHLVTELGADIGGEAPKFNTFLPKVVDAVQERYGVAAAKDVLARLIAGFQQAMRRLREMFSKPEEMAEYGQPETVSQNWVTNLGDVHDTLAKMWASRFGTAAERENASLREMKDRTERDRQIKAFEDYRAPEAPPPTAPEGFTERETPAAGRPPAADYEKIATLRRWLGQLQEARDQEAATGPQMTALRATEAEILGKVRGVESRLTNVARTRLEAVRAEMDGLAHPAEDTRAMALVRQALADAAAVGTGPAPGTARAGAQEAKAQGPAAAPPQRGRAVMPEPAVPARAPVAEPPHPPIEPLAGAPPPEPEYAAKVLAEKEAVWADKSVMGGSKPGIPRNEQFATDIARDRVMRDEVGPEEIASAVERGIPEDALADIGKMYRRAEGETPQQAFDRAVDRWTTVEEADALRHTSDADVYSYDMLKAEGGTDPILGDMFNRLEEAYTGRRPETAADADVPFGAAETRAPEGARGEAAPAEAGRPEGPAPREEPGRRGEVPDEPAREVRPDPNTLPDAAAEGRQAAFDGGPRALPRGYLSPAMKHLQGEWFRAYDKAKAEVLPPEPAPVREPAPKEPAPDVKKAEADHKMADEVADMLEKGVPFNSVTIQSRANRIYGGGLAEGAYSRDRLYDAIELGVNRYIQRHPEEFSTAANVGEAMQTAKKLAALKDSLPTQTVRAGEKDAYQQFSTPPDYAYAAAWVANLKAGDHVLEPSAGVGGLIVHAMTSGVRETTVNELSDKRRGMIAALEPTRVTGEDAAQLHNILPPDIRPTVVIMNPPFSRAAERMGGKMVADEGAKHIEQALQRLEPGGRLVAIVGDGMKPEGTAAVGTARQGTGRAFRDWWAKIGREYDVLANVGVDRDIYTKYGTSFPTRLLVIDKNPPSGRELVTGQVKDAAGLIEHLQEVRNDRGTSEQAAGRAGGPGVAAEGEGVARPRSELPTATGGLGLREGAGGRAGAEVAEPAGAPRRGAGGDGAAGSAVGGEGRPVVPVEPQPGRGGAVSDAGAGTAVGGEPGGRSADRGADGIRPDGSGEREQPGVTPAPEDVLATEDAVTKPDDTGITEAIYETYRPQRVQIVGAKAHPGALVQSAAMASVLPPKSDYKPRIPASLVKSGALSDAQLEAIVYAGHAHSDVMANGKRRGFFIGDGTGVGKGREIAGIFLDNKQNGRTKGVWVSEKRALLNDAQRDWNGLLQPKDEIIDHGKTKSGDEITAKKGILFTTYDTMKSAEQTKTDGEKVRGKERVDQIVEWLGKDFDGVIAFDESHNLGNAVDEKGARGVKKAAQKALAGIALQEKLPNARVVYVSATGATEVGNLAYADRLGLWGEGTPFPNRNDFVSKVQEGGMAAMELVARDMKALGHYIARSLSYDGVSYDRVEHVLNPDQRVTYDKLAEGWQKVLQNFNAALEMTGVTEEGKTLNAKQKSAMLSAFWGGHQRFFNQIITSMQMPSVIKGVEADVKAGRQAVLQLVNTMEAAQERALEKARKGEGDLEDLDMTPRDQLIQLVEKSFPVQQMETYVDENNNVRSRAVQDSSGNAVLNREAVAARERLIDELGSIRVPDGPLEMLMNHFGAENVAEVTGRGQRVVKKPDETGRITTQVEKRGAQSNVADAADFQAGKKKILVFSEAGGTGRSYHAAIDSGSEDARRSHYLVQGGWRADKAVQGFGRTHRTSQASAPIFHLVTTDLQGQKRFISSIARRLGQLGALTKGERRTGDQGLFGMRDNLESTEARDGLRQFFRDVMSDKVEGVTTKDLEEGMGLKLRDPSTGGEVKELPEMSQFLNRVLSLKIDQQNRVFDAFSERMDQAIDRAAAAGTLDTGVEAYKADKITKVSEQTVFTDPRSGAETMHVHLQAHTLNHPVDFDATLAGRNKTGGKKPEGFIVNEQSGNVFAVTSGNDRTDSNGTIVAQVRLTGPTDYQYVDRYKVSQGNWRKVTAEEARPLWDDQFNAVPEYRKSDLHLITGAVLPIWDRLGGSPKIYRLQTDTNERMLGRVIPSSMVDATLDRLGAEARKMTDTPAEIAQRILKGDTAMLANDWKIMSRWVAGENRLELIGPDYRHFEEMKRHGIFSERIDYKTRFFIPTEPAAAASAIEAITKTRPVVSLDDGSGAKFSPRKLTEPAGPALMETREASADELASRERQVDKERAQLQMKGKATRGGQEAADDLPLFGGDRQGTLFSPRRTPEQERTIEKVFAGEKPGFVEQLKAAREDWRRKTLRNVLDPYIGLKDEQPENYVAARMANSTHAAQAGLLELGTLKFDGDTYAMKDRNGGVQDYVARPLHHEAGDFLKWVAGNRAEKLAGEGRENLMSQEDIKNLKSLNQGTLDFDYELSNGKTTRSREAAFLDSLKKYHEFNSNVIDLNVEAGNISRKQGAELKADPFYVPFFRVPDEAGRDFVGPSLSSGLTKQSAFKKLMGGTEQLNKDLWENAISNWSHMVDAALRNKTAAKIADTSVKLGAAREMTLQEVNHLSDKELKAKTTWVMRDGEKVYYAVEDPMVLKAVSALDSIPPGGVIMNTGRWFARTLRAGVTSNPLFALRMLVRDTQNTMATTHVSLNPIKNLADGFAQHDMGGALTNLARSMAGQELQAMKLDPQAADAFVGGGLMRLGSGQEGGIRRTTAANILDTPDKLGEFWHRISNVARAYKEVAAVGEDVNRLALYKQARETGSSHTEASFSARDLQDFTLEGAAQWVRVLGDLTPFLNARAQGLYKLGRVAADSDRSVMAAVGGKVAKSLTMRAAAMIGAMAVADLALQAIYADDPDYKKRTEDDLNMNWWFKVGDTQFRIPKGFEMSAISRLLSSGAEVFFNPEMTGERWVGNLWNLLGQNLQVQLPAVLQPAYDVATNTSRLGRAITPRGLEDLRSEQQSTGSTTLVSRGASAVANTVTRGLGLGETLSPIQMDYLVQAYGGWSAATVLAAADRVARTMSDEPTKPEGDLLATLTQGMMRNDPNPSSRYVDMLYKQGKEVERAYATYRDILTRGHAAEAQQFFRDNQETLQKHGMVAGLMRLEGNLNKQVRLVSNNPDSTPEQKRLQILQLTAMKNRAAQQVFGAP